MRKGLIATIVALPLIIVFALTANLGQNRMKMHHASTQQGDRKIPPYYENPDEVKDLPTVLDPNQFKDENIRKAYKIAQDHPRLFLQLPCACGCDRTDGHKSLLSCYTDKHGEYCGVCQQEAMLAGELFAKGTPVKEIRAKIIEKFIY